MYTIDLHVHTQEYYSGATSTEEEQICAAIACGLDAIVLTDHQRLQSPARLKALNAAYAPFQIFGGVELATWERTLCEFHRVLVFGVHKQHLTREEGFWSYPALHRVVQTHHGVMVLVHPFRFSLDIQLDLTRFPPDAIEAYSPNTPPEMESRILTLARDYDISVVSNSDARHASELGRYYNELPSAPAHEQELLEILRAGHMQCVAARRLLKN